MVSSLKENIIQQHITGTKINTILCHMKGNGLREIGFKATIRCLMKGMWQTKSYIFRTNNKIKFVKVSARLKRIFKVNIHNKL